MLSFDTFFGRLIRMTLAWNMKPECHISAQRQKLPQVTYFERFCCCCNLTSFFGRIMRHTWNTTPESVEFVFSDKMYHRQTILSYFIYFVIWYPFLGHSCSWLIFEIWHLRVSYSCSAAKGTTNFERILKYFCFWRPFSGVFSQLLTSKIFCAMIYI